MSTVLRILVIEDSEDDALLVLHKVKKAGFDIEYERIESAEEMQNLLKEKKWDIILSDYKMPHFDGLQALKILKDSGIDLPFIIISGTIGEEVAVEAMRAGAHDYIMKNNLKRLIPTIERELRESKNRSERKLLEQKEKLAEKERLANLHYFESIDKINRSLQGIKTIDDTLGDLLDIVLAVFDCDRAWLVYPCDLEAASWKVLMEKTRPEFPGALEQNIEVPIDSEVIELFKTLLASDNPTQFIPDQVAKRFNFQSQITIAIHPKVGKPWVFGVHQCSYPRVWTLQEERLFKEVGRSLADSLTSLLILRNLKESEEKYRTLIHRINAAVIVYKSDTKISACNRIAQELLGLTEEELIGKTPADDIWQFYNEDGVRLIKSEHPVNIVINSKKVLRNLIIRVNRANNNDVWILVDADPVYNAANEIDEVIVTFIDISERKQQEEKVRRLNRLYAFLSNINETIVRTKNIHTLFDEVCHIAIEDGGFIASWVGMLSNEDKINVIAYACNNKDISEFLKSKLNDPENKDCLAKQAIRSKNVVYINNLEGEKEGSTLIEQSLQIGIKSSISLPIKVLGKIYGVFSLYSRDAYLFDETELKLLTELTLDISFALEFNEHESAVHQQLQYTKALNKIAGIIISSDESKNILENTSNIIGETLNVDRSLIYDVSFDKEEVIGLCEWLNPAAPNVLPIKTKYALNDFIGGIKEIRRTHKPIISNASNINSNLLKDGSGKMLHEQMKIKSLLWYPFAFYPSGFYVIVLNVIHNERNWTEKEFEFLNSVSKQVSIALEKIKLLDDRKKAEEEIKANEIKFRTVADYTLDWEYWVGTNKEIIYMSPSCEMITGYTREEFKNDESLMDKIIHPDDMEVYYKHYTGFCGSRLNCPAEEIEVRIIHKNGSLKTIQHLCRPIFNVDNVFLGRRISNRDVTARKLTEEALKESESRNRALLSAIPDLIFLISRDGIFLDYKSESNELLRDPKNFIGKHIREVLPIDIAIQTLEKTGELLSTGEPQVYEYRLMLNNAIKVYETRLVLCGENQILAMVRDITLRKESEESIRKLSRAVEQSPATIVITDVNGNIEYVNKKFTEVTGYTFDDVKKQNPRILKSGFMSKDNYKDMWQTVLSGKEWFGEFYNKKKSGEFYWEAASISPIFNIKGEISNFLAIKLDITEQKKMTAELIEAKEKAEEMNKVKSYFFANMSHELRTPFVGILGFAELLADSLSNVELKNYAEQILKSGKRLTDTLNKILNVTRLEFDKIELKVTSIDVNKLIEETTLLYSQTAKNNNSIVQTELNFDIVKIKADEKLLEEILNNLISNAVKYTQNGSIKITSNTVKLNGLDYLKLVIADTGVGIPKDLQSIIWHEFRQVSEGLNRSFEGTGLGLTITKKCVELLGGTITLESEVGKGSTFTVQLPAIKADIDIVEKSIPEKQVESNGLITDRKPKILYVEDDITSLSYIAIILKSKYDVDTSLTAQKALEYVANNEYDLLMLDINLGRGMDGVELMQQIRKIRLYKNKPIVAVTAYAAETDKAEFLAKGFTSYISKPFSSADLKDLLKKLLK